MKVLGIDFGTTSFSACVYDDEADQSWFAAGYNSSHKAAGLKREFRIDQVRQDLYSFIEKLSGEFSLAEIEAISVTGNMHSFFGRAANHRYHHGRMSGWRSTGMGCPMLSMSMRLSNPGFPPSVQGEFRHAVTTLLHLLETGLGAKGFAGCSLHLPRPHCPRLSTSAPTEGAGITDHF